MQIRQADATSMIRLEPNPVEGGNAIVINSQVDSGIYENWIFFSKGALREVLVAKGNKVDMSAAGKIVDLDECTIEKSNLGTAISLKMKAGYTYPLNYLKLDMLLQLRAGI